MPIPIEVVLLRRRCLLRFKQDIVDDFGELTRLPPSAILPLPLLLRRRWVFRTGFVARLIVVRGLPGIHVAGSSSSAAVLGALFCLHGRRWLKVCCRLTVVRPLQILPILTWVPLFDMSLDLVEPPRLAAVNAVDQSTFGLCLPLRSGILMPDPSLLFL